MKDRLLEIYVSDEHDPYVNLALEEFLCEHYEIGSRILLYLWQNDNTVVIGRNQNAYEQCHMNFIKEHHIKIARRLSGGGAVYHDLGNLNYTIISGNKLFSKEENTKMIIDSIHKFGIHAVPSGRNDIAADGYKISGTAYFTGRYASYQHGCIMVHTDQETMYKALRIRQDKIISKNIKSVNARTINLQELCGSMDVGKLERQIIKTFCEKYRNHRTVSMGPLYENVNYKQLLQRYSSRSWNIEENADNKADIYGRLSFGDCSIVFHVEDGIVLKTKIYTDSLLVDQILQAEEILSGIPYDKYSIVKVLEEYEKDGNICRELKELILSKMENERLCMI